MGGKPKTETKTEVKETKAGPPRPPPKPGMLAAVLVHPDPLFVCRGC